MWSYDGHIVRSGTAGRFHVSFVKMRPAPRTGRCTTSSGALVSTNQPFDLAVSATSVLVIAIVGVNALTVAVTVAVIVTSAVVIV